MHRLVKSLCVVAAKNPPPICLAVPYLKKELSLCLDFYNLDLSNKSISGCLKLEARVAFIVVEKLDLGCFHIPLYNVAAQQTAAAVVQSIRAARVKKDLF